MYTSEKVIYLREESAINASYAQSALIAVLVEGVFILTLIPETLNVRI